MTLKKKKTKVVKKKNNQKSIRSRANQFLKAILSMKVYGMFFFSQDLLIEQRIQTFLSDHAKAHGQLYLPDDRRIYFHYFKG